MEPDELREAAIKLFGERGWVAALATALGIERTQIWRYLNAKTTVPGPVAAAVRCWLRRFDETGEAPGESGGG